MFTTSIKRALMKAIQEKIKEAQQLFDKEIAELKGEHKDKIGAIISQTELLINNAHEDFKNQKEGSLKKHITNILSKVI